MAFNQNNRSRSSSRFSFMAMLVLAILCVALMLFSPLVQSESLQQQQQQDGEQKKNRDQCALYLTRSKIQNGGRAIVAGADIFKFTMFGGGVSLPVHTNIVRRSLLYNYIYALTNDNEPDYVMVAFGEAMLFNHAPDQLKTARHHYDGPTPIFPISDNDFTTHSTFTPIIYRSLHSVMRGEEIFVTYGSTAWFEERGLQAMEQLFTEEVYHTEEELQQQQQPYHCLSNIEMRPSQLPTRYKLVNNNIVVLEDSEDDNDVDVVNVDVGVGAFATKAFAAGSVVVVSPVLTLDKTILYHYHRNQTAQQRQEQKKQRQRLEQQQQESGEERGGGNTGSDDNETNSSWMLSALVNYCYGDANSDVLVLPLASATIINHAPAATRSSSTTTTTRKANVRLEWYDWDTNSNVINSNRSQLTYKELDKLGYAAFDVAFVALEDISKDDELLIDYGADWEEAWNQYLRTCVFASQDTATTTTTTGEGEEEMTAPCLFRHELKMPEGLFPRHWARDTSSQN